MLDNLNYRSLAAQISSLDEGWHSDPRIKWEAWTSGTVRFSWFPCLIKVLCYVIEKACLCLSCFLEARITEYMYGQFDASRFCDGSNCVYLSVVRGGMAE